MRRIAGREGGPIRVRMTLDVRAGFGRHAMEIALSGDGAWTGRSGDLRLRLRGAADARPAATLDGALVLDLVVGPDRRHDLVLEIGADDLPHEPEPPDELWRRTQQAWRAAVPRLPQALGARDARHAVAVLTGLTSTDGGMVAAATTSLPERADEGRNYDYRFAWIRDQCFAGLAAVRAGLDDLADAAVDFVSRRLLADGAGLRPAYTVDGGNVPDQRSLDLGGYPGSGVREGNHVNHQFQLDAFGEALLLLGAAARTGRRTDEARRAAEVAAGAIRATWLRPDAGIWELEPRRWTHSRLICAAGLRAAGEAFGAAAEWDRLAGELVREQRRIGVDPSGRWRRAPDDDRVDAALLLPMIRGLHPDDPRNLATMVAVQQDLTEDGFVYRFRQGEGALGDAEGAFLLCGLILALAEMRTGDREAAVRRFERTRSACGPPGLYSEEWDVGQRQMRGNVPQAFVHAVLLDASVQLASGAAAPWI
jgi:GH15 family glucan-1,4-alpha-glucosidase